MAAATAPPPNQMILYRMEHLISRQAWVQNKLRSVCVLCAKRFFLGGKHHCRRCGEVFCSDCTRFEATELPAIGRTKVRVCKMCFARDLQDQSLLVLSRSSSEDEEAEAELIRKTEMMLFSPNQQVLARANVKAEKSLLDDCDARTTANSDISLECHKSSSNVSSSSSAPSPVRRHPPNRRDHHYDV